MSVEVTQDERESVELLRNVPTRPRWIELFSSNTLFGQPGIYPDGPTMVPASGAPLDRRGARAIVAAYDHRTADPDESGLSVFDDSAVTRRVPDAAVRAALAMLSGGPADPILRGFLDEVSPVETIGIGEPTGQGRVIGTTAAAGPGHRVLNDRYRAEHPAVIAPSLAHALVHHGERASCHEESTLHGILAAVHTWLIAADASVARFGTELARRQASLTITLLNARAPGSARASIRCPDGPGTIPDGNSMLQCPDLWSIPFNSRGPADCDPVVPDAARSAIGRLAAPDAPEVPRFYDDDLGRWLTEHMGAGRWFGPVVRARAGRALGL